MRFNSNSFKKFDFTEESIKKYFDNAKRDLKIARNDPHLEVSFLYAYQALIKVGITLIAMEGRVKVRSTPGHHIKVIEALAELLNDEDIKVLGHAMRKKRNLDMYEGGQIVTKKEVEDYTGFVKSVVDQVRVRMKNN